MLEFNRDSNLSGEIFKGWSLLGVEEEKTIDLNETLEEQLCFVEPLISNKNSPKDIAFRKLYSVKAGLEMLQEARNTEEKVHRIAQEKLLSLRERYEEEYQTASTDSYATWLFGYKAEFVQCGAVDQEVVSVLAPLFENLKQKNLSDLHRVRLYAKASEFHRQQKPLITKFHMGGHIFRSSVEQTDLKPFSQGRGVFRSSMEAKLTQKGDPEKKRALLSNGWTQSISCRSKAPLSYGRSGAYTDFKDVTTNIQALKRDLEILREAGGEPLVDLGVSKGKLEKKIQKREGILLNMAAASISAQAERVGKELEELLKKKESSFILETKTFSFNQISLLKPKENELNMIRDMEWALQQFEGKKILFDGTSGVDERGNLHIALKLEDPKTKRPLELVSKTALYNISVKGSGIQEEIELNKRALEKTRSLFKAYGEWVSKKGTSEQKAAYGEEFIKFLELEKELKEGKDSFADYDLPARLALSLNFLGRISINCKSGKDRTGGLCEELSLAYIRRHSEKAKLPEESVMRREVHGKSLSLYITWVNTFMKCYKFPPNELAHTGKGLVERWTSLEPLFLCS